MLPACDACNPAVSPGRRLAGILQRSFLQSSFLVAWATEGGEELRLWWWQTDLLSEFGGADLLRRDLPRTWPWAMLQAVREAALDKDQELRGRASDPTQRLSPYRFGFELDEPIVERLRAHKRCGLPRRLIQEVVPNHPGTAEVSIAPNLEALKDPFVARLQRAQKAAIETLVRLLGVSGKVARFRQLLELGLHNRELSSEADLRALTRALESRLLPLVQQGGRVRIA
jgi:hypothetical protein